MSGMSSLFGEEAVPAPKAPKTAASGGWITAHCDGGARGNPGPAGYGAVLVAESGEKLAELSEFLGICSNNVAEYRGLLGCLEWTVAHGHTRLRVVSDSLLMVNQIKGKFKINSPDLKPLWQQAKTLIAKLEGFEISHALRHKNKDADRLANEAMDRGMDRGMGRPAAEPTATPYPQKSSAPQPPPPKPASPAMLRGFVRDGAIHLLGDARLPNGTFVKVIPE